MGQDYLWHLPTGDILLTPRCVQPLVKLWEGTPDNPERMLIFDASNSCNNQAVIC